MLRKIHRTNFFHIKLLDHTNFKCQNGLVLHPPQVFYFNGLLRHLWKGEVLFFDNNNHLQIGPLRKEKPSRRRVRPRPTNAHHDDTFRPEDSSDSEEDQ
jgi:hypothetical protein